MRALVVTLLIGWGAGWFVARSHAFGPVRVALAGWRDTTTAQLADVSAWRGIARGAGLRAALLTARGAVLAFLAGVVRCAACSGFWIGCGLGTAWPVAGGGVVGALATGAAVMGTNALLDSVTGAFAAIEAAAWSINDNADEFVAAAARAAADCRPDVN